MPYELYWMVERRVIGTRMYGEVTIEDMTQSGDETLDYLEQGQAPMFLFVDMREVTKFPRNFAQMSKQLSVYDFTNPKFAWLITLSGDRLLNLFGTIMSKVTSVPMKIFTNEADALQFIAYNAPDLADDLTHFKSLSS